jgi:hypothetical protein
MTPVLLVLDGFAVGIITAFVAAWVWANRVAPAKPWVDNSPEGIDRRALAALAKAGGWRRESALFRRDREAS